VAADLGALFQHGDADVLAVFFRPLFQTDGRRQAGGAAADDDDVILHDLPLDALKSLQRRQIVDDGFLAGVFRAALDGFFGHVFP
jgi:hypothetical protein